MKTKTVLSRGSTLRTDAYHCLVILSKLGPKWEWIERRHFRAVREDEWIKEMGEKWTEPEFCTFLFAPNAEECFEKAVRRLVREGQVETSPTGEEWTR
jgi:hypothetical protein